MSHDEVATRHDSRLERRIAPHVAVHATRSGFRLLATGLDAFVARVGLIELADRTLDLQYYIFHGDTTGEIIVDRLIAAADRGVRVRLLLDDWGTIEKKDEVVVGLDAHPRIEIRLFNPYLHRSGMGRVGELVRSFSRVNRRMHNKQLIADGVAVVLGGRNIGDEYFGLGELDFQDVDVLAGGPIVRESTAIFEAYWESTFAKPVSALGAPAPNSEQFDAARRALAERVEQRRNSQYAEALLESPLATDLREARDVLPHWADARMFADPPGKLTEPAGTRGPQYLGAHVAAAVGSAQSELLLVSPYFVPGKEGVATLAGKRRAGASVSVLTNSLAATDVWLVHAGYRKYRRALLRQDVRLYELKAEGRAARCATRQSAPPERAYTGNIRVRSPIGIHRLDEPRCALHRSEHRGRRADRESSARRGSGGPVRALEQSRHLVRRLPERRTASGVARHGWRPGDALHPGAGGGILATTRCRRLFNPPDRLADLAPHDTWPVARCRD